MSLSLSRKRRLRLNNEESITDGNSSAELLSATQTQSFAAVRCGKIQQIRLKNFMCHSHIVIDFHDRVNFIVGNNGSGKSAIMNALVLGLGSKARATSRFGSISQFIKTGERSAKIEITFSNAGPESYENEVYGDSITVERTLTQNGGSSYIIKNDSGHIISKKIADLARILVYHNMQVDNPVFVLNQDSAREFLKELNPQKGYEMFMKATQMDLIYETLHECAYTHKEQQINLKFIKKKIQTMRDELVEMSSKLEILNNLEKAKDNLKIFKSEHAWWKVHQYEIELEEFLNEFSCIQKQLREKNNEPQSKEDLKTEIMDQISELERNLEAKKAEFDSQNTLHIEIQRKINMVVQKCSDLSLCIDNLKKKKLFMEKSVVDLQAHLEERQHTNIDEMKRQDELALNEHRRELEEVINMLATTKRDMKIFIESKEEKKEKEKQLRDQKINLNINLDRFRSRISSINPNAKDKLTPFGNEVMQLVAEIEKSYNNGRFTKKPRGPIGSYVEVPKTKYRNIIEQQLGNLVKAFIVDNSKDRQTLDLIIRRVCPQFRCTIITTRFQEKVYDVRNGCVKPPNGTFLLMNEIKCSDPVVMNCLIDRLRVEAVLLTDDVDIAEQLSSQIENVPVNMAKILVAKNVVALEYYPEPHYRIYSLTIRPARYIQVDAQQHVAALKCEAATVQQKIEKIEMELKSVMSKIYADNELIAEKREILQEQEKKQSELRAAIAAIENNDYPEHIEVEILKNELTILQSKNLPEIISFLDKKKKELIDIGPEKERFEGESREQANVLHNIQKDIDSLTQKIDELRRKIRRIQSTLVENQKLVAALKEKYNKLQKEKEKKENELSILMENASKWGERVSTERDEQDILNDISKMEALPRQRSNIPENIDDLRSNICEKRMLIEKEESFYKIAKDAVQTLVRSLHNRFNFATKLKQHMALMLQYVFQQLLKARNFSGTVNIDHDKKVLVLNVIPRDKHLENAISSTRSLSGGERSYSTVAFLVALWTCVDHRFFFMDEYDVFTDDVNRDCLNMLLINEGRERPGRQYVLLTPQDMAIQSDEIVKIHRLGSPM